MRYAYTAALFAALATSIQAHTWVEQMMVIANNGTLVGEPGFARGNVLRTAPNFGDPLMVNLLPPNGRPANDILATDPICKSTQTTQTQTNGSPRLKAAAGANIALRYQENGHVTLPENQPGKPDNRGTVFVYGTTDSKPDDTLLAIHRIWTPDGQGGDKRGVLLSTRNFDDGQCYQVNSGSISTQRQGEFKFTPNQLMGSNLWCQNNIQIPTTAPSGKPYTLYWVWDWPTAPGTASFPEGKQEIYTTCMDVDITSDVSAVSASGNGNAKVNAGSNVGTAINFAKGQDIGDAGIPDQLANIANPTAVIMSKFIPFSGQNAPSAPSGISSGRAPSGAAAASDTAAVSAISAVPNKETTTATSTAAAVTSTVPAQAASGAAGSQATRHRTRPSVSPIPTPSSSPSAARSAAQNTGTAVTAPNAVTSGTVTVTSVAGAGATVTQVQTLVSTIVQTKLETVTAAASSQGVSKREVPCSKTESVYRLRARNAFYVASGDDEC